uniref:Cadherin homolog n=1 Tax=Botryllus schlosseri TaxID=30301 RepID=Q17281_BOTSH|nr:cadherin homolog [Botryllus schlosseri]
MSIFWKFLTFFPITVFNLPLKIPSSHVHFTKNSFYLVSWNLLKPTDLCPNKAKPNQTWFMSKVYDRSQNFPNMDITLSGFPVTIMPSRQTVQSTFRELRVDVCSLKNNNCFFLFVMQLSCENKSRYTNLNKLRSPREAYKLFGGMGPSIPQISTAVLLAVHYAEGQWTYLNKESQRDPFTRRLKVVKIHSEDPTTVTYDISGDFGTKFDIDHESGQIWQVEAVDRETKDRYTITATSADANGNPTEDPVRFDIVVTDINDNYPVFVESSLTGSVEELHDTGPDSTPFMQVKATDEDLGFNAEIRFKIEDGSDTPESPSGNRFIIDPVSGWVRVNGDDLNYESNPVVRFNVIAVDNNGGPGSNEKKSEVVVSVTDSNDHAPEFGSSYRLNHCRKYQNLVPHCIDVRYDTDEGVNKKVYFEILDGNTGGAFTIVSKPSATGQSLGELQLVKPLDFESGIVSYKLKIKAYNKDASNAADVAYATESTLSITVIDANEPPIFRDTPYNYRRTEGPAPAEPIPIIQVHAEDIDFNKNQTVTYSLEDPENWFDIVATTGQITLTGALDREATANGVYHLKVIATDNYDHGNPASGSEEVAITIEDINDNPPAPDWGQEVATAYVCEKATNRTARHIKATDPDSAVNGPPFTLRLDDSVDKPSGVFEAVDDDSVNLIAEFSDYGLSSGSATVSLIFTVTDGGTVSQTARTTLTATTICKCGDDGEFTCKDATAAAFPYAIIIAVIAVILLIAILVFAVVTYKRRQAAMILKEPFFDDEDDIRETVQVYQEEGGEEDQDTYDLSALRGPLLEDPNQPIRKTQMPLIQQAPRPRRPNAPDDITNIIGEAKDAADEDPSAPPFDSLLVFDYEGAGSDAGSLSSINTATTDGSVDYDYLNDWGPRFNRLAGMLYEGS